VSDIACAPMDREAMHREQQSQITASMREDFKRREEIRRLASTTPALPRSIRSLTSTTPTVRDTLGVSRGRSDESPGANPRDVGHFWRRALYFGVIRPRRGEWEGPARLRGNMIDELDESAVLTTRDIEKLLKIPRQTQMDLRARGGFIPALFCGAQSLLSQRGCAAVDRRARGEGGRC
jgi:hypothetical protein